MGLRVPAVRAGRGGVRERARAAGPRILRGGRVLDAPPAAQALPRAGAVRRQHGGQLRDGPGEEGQRAEVGVGGLGFEEVETGGLAC